VSASTQAARPGATESLKAGLPDFAARLEAWMPRATTAQLWARRGNEFEPELQISGHFDPRYDSRGARAVRKVMERYGSYAVAAHLSYMVTQYSLEVQFLTPEIGREAGALWRGLAGPR